MKKVITIALAAFVAVALSACGSRQRDKERDNEQTEHDSRGNVASQDMSMDEEAVSVAGYGQPDSDALEASGGEMPCVVDFSATWCGPCRQLKPYFKEMEETYAGQADFRTVDIDENPALASKHNVNAVPTVIIFSDSSMATELYRVTGFDPQGLSEAIMKFI